jgi:hypothetical protein
MTCVVQLRGVRRLAGEAVIPPKSLRVLDDVVGRARPLLWDLWAGCTLVVSREPPYYQVTNDTDEPVTVSAWLEVQ